MKGWICHKCGKKLEDQSKILCKECKEEVKDKFICRECGELKDKRFKYQTLCRDCAKRHNFMPIFHPSIDPECKNPYQSIWQCKDCGMIERGGF